MFTNLGKAGYGCVIKNAQGAIVAAIHGSFPGISNPSIAEALGMREALNWIKELQVTNIILESDALLIIEALNSSTSYSSFVGLIIEDCRLFALQIQSLSFVCVKRSANQLFKRSGFFV